MGKNELYCDNMQNNKNKNNKDIAKSCFFSLSPKQFSLLSSLLGILLIDNLDASQQNSIGNFIVGIGQTILIAAAQQQLLESNIEKNDNIRNQISMLKKQISLLEGSL